VLDSVFLLFSFFSGFFIVFAVSKFLQHALHNSFFAESGDQLVACFAFLLLDNKHCSSIASFHTFSPYCNSFRQKLELPLWGMTGGAGGGAEGGGAIGGRSGGVFLLARAMARSIREIISSAPAKIPIFLKSTLLLSPSVSGNAVASTVGLGVRVVGSSVRTTTSGVGLPTGRWVGFAVGLGVTQVQLACVAQSGFLQKLW